MKKISLVVGYIIILVSMLLASGILFNIQPMTTMLSNYNIATVNGQISLIPPIFGVLTGVILVIYAKGGFGNGKI